MKNNHPHITHKSVFVTGAGGSIGSVLCARILELEPARLIMLNLTESGLASLMRDLAPLQARHPAVVCSFVLGSVTDEWLLKRWMRDVDTVIHAAAYKYVPICEANPCAAVVNNINGTIAVATVAAEMRVQRCILISTDKAVKPSSVMGATKYLAERVWAQYGHGFFALRFGNVYDSVGSVLPLWRAQIASGGPVTVTDAGCMRYFMSINEACSFIVNSLLLGDEWYGTFVYDMGEPHNLLSMAKQLIIESGKPCLIELTGLRPGEKLIEELSVGLCIDTGLLRILQVDDSPLATEDEIGHIFELVINALHHREETVRAQLWSLINASHDVCDLEMAES